ncbi:Ran-binding protein, putative [Entamoeba histolytica]
MNLLFQNEHLFDEACTNYFRHPNQSHVLNNYLNTPLPSDLVDQLVKFFSSRNIYTTQYISQLLIRHLNNHTLNYSYDKLIHSLVPYACIVGSPYSDLYCKLLIKKWNKMPDMMEQSTYELCQACESKIATEEGKGIMYLIGNLIKEFIETKEVDSITIQIFKEKCLLRIVETIITIIRWIQIENNEQEIQCKIALETLKIALEYPFSNGYEEEEDIVLEIPMGYASILSSIGLQEKMIRMFVPGNHLEALVECMITLASVRENLFSGTTRQQYNEFLSKFGGMICEAAENEKMAVAAGRYLDRMTRTRSVKAQYHLTQAAKLIERISENYLEHKNSFYYLLTTFARWSHRLYECGEEKGNVIETLKEVSKSVIEGAFNNSEIIEEEDIEGIMEGFGEITRVNLMFTVEEMTKHIERVTKEIEHIIEIKGSLQRIQKECERLSIGIGLISIIINHQVINGTNETQEQLDIQLMKIGIEIINKEMNIIKTIPFGYGVKEIEINILRFFESIRNVFLNESISRTTEKYIIEILEIQNLNDLIIAIMNKIIFNLHYFIDIHYESIIKQSLLIIEKYSRKEKTSKMLLEYGLLDKILDEPLTQKITKLSVKTKKMFFQAICNLIITIPKVHFSVLLNKLESSFHLQPNDYESKLLLYHSFFLSLPPESIHYLGFIDFVHKILPIFIKNTSLPSFVSFLSDIANIKPFRSLYSIQTPDALILYHDICESLMKILPSIIELNEDEMVSYLEDCIQSINSILSSDTIPFGALYVYNDRTHHVLMQTIISICISHKWDFVSFYPKYTKLIFTLFCNIGMVSCDDFFGNHLHETLLFLFNALQSGEESAIPVFEQIILFTFKSHLLKSVRIITTPSTDHSLLLSQHLDLVKNIIEILLQNLLNGNMDLYCTSKALLPSLLLYPKIYHHLKSSLLLKYSNSPDLNLAFCQLDASISSSCDGDAYDNFFNACQVFQHTSLSLLKQ